MLRSFKSIIGSALHAQDGKIGRSDDLLFDDEQWTIRYLVVKTGGLLNRKRVLISPLGIAQVDWLGHALELRLTRHQIEASPDVDTDQPVFRKMEARFFDHYGWPYYWTDTSVWGVDPRSPFIIGDQVHAKSGEEATHLRSCRKVTGYAIEAQDSGVGHVQDFLIEDGSWTVRYLVVDIKNWHRSRSVLIAPQWVSSIDWSARSIRVDLMKIMIEDSPELDPDIPVNRHYEERLHEHYQRPKYWRPIRKVG